MNLGKWREEMNAWRFFRSMIVTYIVAFAANQVSAADLEPSIDELATDIGSQLTKRQVSKLAVVGFTDLNGYQSALGDFVSEELVTALFSAGNFDVVERRELDRVLAEQEKYTEGIFDRETITDLGHLLGIDAIVTGSITNLGERIKVNSRAISVESGKVFAAASISVDRDPIVDQLMGQQSANAIGGNLDNGGFGAQRSDVFFKNSFLHVVPTSISVSTDKKTVRVATDFRNLTKDPLLIGFKSQSHLFIAALDNTGDNLIGNDVAGLTKIGTAEIIRSDPDRYTVIEPGSLAVVIWEFISAPPQREKITGREFSFSGELFRLTDKGSKQFSVGLSGVEAN